MKKENNKLKFTLVWSSCICILLLMVFLGVSSSVKGTLAAETYTLYSCDSGATLVSGDQCLKAENGAESTESEAKSHSCPSDYPGTCYVTKSFNGDWGYSCNCYKDANTTTATCAGEITRYDYQANGNADYTCSSIPSNASVSGYCCIKKESSDNENQNEDVNNGNQNEDGECVGADCSDNETEESICNVTSCPAGEYLVEENGCKKCRTCTEGKVCYGGTSKPQSCSEGSEPNDDATTCVQIKQCYCYGVNGGGESCKYMTAFDADEFGAVLSSDSKCSGSNVSLKFTVNFIVNGSINKTFVCENGDIDDTKTCTKKTLYAGETWYSDKECTTSIVVQDYVTGNTNYYRCTGNTNSETGNNDNGNTNPGTNLTPDSTPEPDDDNSNVEPLPESSSNVEENPPTGEIAIFVVWVIAAMAIVYSIWYFKQVREN